MLDKNKEAIEKADQKAEAKIDSIIKKSEERSWRRKMVKNEQGKYVYMGSKYYYTGTRDDRKKHLLALGMLSALTLLAALVVGFQPIPGLTRSFYVLIPFAAHLLLAVLMCWNTILLAWAGEPIPDFEFKNLKRNYPAVAGCGMVAAALAAVSEIFYLIRNFNTDSIQQGLLFILAEAVAAVAMMRILKLYKNMKWELRE